MKRFFAISLALAMMLALASCGGDKDNTSSTAASSTASTEQTSSVAVQSTISIPPVSSTAPVESNNIAMLSTTVAIDMNTGLKAGDKGYQAYYGDGAADANLKFLNDGDMAESSGWQLASGQTELNATTTPAWKSGDPAPKGYYVTNDGTQCFKKTALENVFIGYTFEAANIDTIVISEEADSKITAFEDGGFTVEYTKDGKTWTKIKAPKVTRALGETNEKVNVDTVKFDAIDGATGIRVNITSGESKYAPKVVELEVLKVAADTANDATSSAEGTTAE